MERMKTGGCWKTAATSAVQVMCTVSSSPVTPRNSPQLPPTTRSSYHRSKVNFSCNTLINCSSNNNLIMPNLIPSCLSPVQLHLLRRFTCAWHTLCPVASH
ncbi:unnamed protein product, partial [Sphacelaria rigidula]